MAEAAKFLAKGDVSLAYRNADFAAPYATDEDRQGQVIALVAKIAEQANKLLADANAKYAAGKYAEALEGYRILVGMPKLPAAGQARQKLHEAEQNPAVASALREPRAAILYDQVDLLLGGWTSKGDVKVASDKAPHGAAGAGTDCVDDYILAKQLCVEDRIKLTKLLTPIAKGFSDTPTGQKADKLLKQLLADPAFAAAFNTKQADENVRDDYKLAKLYVQNDKPEKARELFEKVISSSPDSEWAQKARKDLESLNAANP